MKPEGRQAPCKGQVPVFEFIARRLQKWAEDQRGNTALIVGLSACLLVCATGGAIDYSRAYGIRSRLQDASDMAVLSAAVDPSKTEAQMQVIADLAFDQNVAGTSVGATTKHLSKITDSSGNNLLLYTVAAHVPTNFLGLIGMTTIDVSVLSKSDATIRNTEIAFVLDSTGSMVNGGRMTNLKSSVDSMMASLLDSNGANSANTKVAVVPFDTQVKIAPGTGLSYIDYGTSSISESCASGTNGYLCNILKDSYDKICKSAVDVAACKSRVKINYKTYTSNGRNYYETQFYSYEGTSPAYTLYSYAEVSYTVTTTGSGGTSTNRETGSTTTTTSSSSTTETFVSQTGSAGAATTLNTYNAVPSGFTSGSSSIMTTSTGNSNGYGALAAQSYSTSSSYKTNATYTLNGVVNSNSTYGNTKWVNFPAVNSSQSAWTGCVIDRYKDASTALSYDISAAPSVAGTANSLYPARPCNNSALQSVMGLTTDIASARARVQAMSPAGSTNITIGVQWGMEVLSPDVPFTGGSAWKTPLYTKYMIVVTDGENTQSRYSSVASDIDARTALACQAAKDNGIIVYTVKVVQGNSAMLQACASNASYFYDLSSASQLGDTMRSILKSIRKIKLAQ